MSLARARRARRGIRAMGTLGLVLSVCVIASANPGAAKPTNVRKVPAPAVLSWVEAANRGCDSANSDPWQDGLWRCVFSDDFSGRALNLARWNPVTTTGSGFSTGVPPGYVCYLYDPRTVSVSSGTLKLAVVKVNDRFECGGPARQPTRFIGGAVSTKNRLAMTYGRFEVRARVATAKRDGLQSSIRLRPDRRSYGEDSGEIVLADYFSALPGRVLPVVRYRSAGPDPTASNPQCTLADSDAFHTYTATWTPDLIELQVDGVTCVSTTWSLGRRIPRPAPFNRPFFLALFEGLGSSDVMYDPKRPPKFPVMMEVDYVHIWGRPDEAD